MKMTANSPLRRAVIIPLILILAGACTREVPETAESERTVITVALPGQTKTTMGPSDNGIHHLYWSEGDKIAINGKVSNPLSGIGSQTGVAKFSFSNNLSTPYRILYPSSFHKNNATITLPATQTYTAGTFSSGTYPLAGYVTTDSNEPVTLHNLCALVRLSVKKDPAFEAGKLTQVRFTGNNDEQVCGDFAIDYSSASLSPAGEAGEGRSITLSLLQSLPTTDALDLFLVVPAGTYRNGFSIVMEDDAQHALSKVTRNSVTLKAGSIARMSAFSFNPSEGGTEFFLEDIIEEDLEMEESYNIKGRVIDKDGDPVKDVVVTDGILCVQTREDGSFYLNSNLEKVKFVYISTPNGYLPKVENGIPRFYKLLSSCTVSGGVYNVGDFVLTPMDNPNQFTLFISADPQPRNSGSTLDNVAYRSLRACEALYREEKETAATITDRQVIGICLGDLVHGNSETNLNLMDTYASQLATLGYPTFNIIGNHDNDTSAADDDGGALKFESLFGPRNYSFNMGGIHFVFLDNLIMKIGSSSKKLDDYTQGLTDDIWEWLQADMSYIPTTTKIMVFAHSPMFKLESGSERTNTATHGSDYGSLFDAYVETHAWAGHTHSTFNYIYPTSHRHKRVQVHTLARSTGDLWVNDYLSNGTPQGFTIVDVNNGKLSWHFHPTKYLLSNFHGTKGEPAYTWRDWDYVSNVATMRDTGNPLDESYQMHVYPTGSYGDNYVYANIFLWDEKWDLPVLSIQGGSTRTMSHVEAYDGSTPLESCHDLADTELKSFYKNTYGSTLGSDFDGIYPGLHTLFRAQGPEHGTGTVTVTDRFGNEYSRTITW